MFEYRIWSDYKVQESNKPFPVSWGIDYILVDADSEKQALEIAKEIFN